MREKSYLIILGVVLALAAGLIVYSQTLAFSWDEGFHLLTARQILHGREPYLDFIFPQTPLNAYWNALWLRVLGDSWRTVHAVAAVMTALSVLLIAAYVLRRFPVPSWRLPCAVATAVVVGANVAVVKFGTVGQAYGLCLFSIVAAFCITVAAVGRRNLLLPAAAGALACTAVNASLLTAPVGPILLIWMWVYNREGSRVLKAAVYALAAIIPTLPLLRLFVRGPRQTLFDIFDYHFFYRQVDWDGSITHDIDVMFGWLDSAQALSLVALAVAGVVYVVTRSGWDRSQRGEIYLGAWLAAGESCYIATAHPNFSWYYLLAVPFIAVPASAGLYAIGSKLTPRPAWPVAMLCLVTGLDLGKAMFDRRESTSWSDVEKLAAAVNRVTPPDAVLLAHETTYFASGHAPYPGNEMADSHKLNLPPDQAGDMHVISKEELDRRIRAGMFDTVEIDDDDDRIQALGLKTLYQNSTKIDDTWLFWGKVKP